MWIEMWNNVEKKIYVAQRNYYDKQQQQPNAFFIILIIRMAKQILFNVYYLAEWFN